MDSNYPSILGREACVVRNEEWDRERFTESRLMDPDKFREVFDEIGLTHAEDSDTCGL